MDKDFQKPYLKDNSHFLDPEDLIRQLDIQEGAEVADFGCSSGFFTLPLAKRLNGTGKIYALEIVKEKIESLESQAKLAGLSNINTSRVNLEMPGGSKLPDNCVDWVVMINMLFENKNKKQILAEAMRVLRESGKVLVMEWEQKESPVGPDINIRISKEALIELANALGLLAEREIKVSEYHYCLIFNSQK
jgi:ubiquinone/menaquinone biosynthesis C-methylase UbiE